MEITISGSMRFLNEMRRFQRIFIGMGIRCHVPKPSTTLSLDELYQRHLENIKKSDVLFVANVHGYIGESVTREIQDAKALRKPVIYLEEVNLDQDIKLRPKMVALIGSRKYEDKFLSEARKLIDDGKIPLLPAIFKRPSNSHPSPELHTQIDTVQKLAMLSADEIYVINPNGYIGDDTLEEIIWATEQGLKIRYLFDINNILEQVKRRYHDDNERNDNADYKSKSEDDS